MNKKEFGFYYKDKVFWGFDSVESALAEANELYDGSIDKSCVLARYRLPYGFFQDVIAKEVGGDDEPLGDEYMYDEKGNKIFYKRSK